MKDTEKLDLINAIVTEALEYDTYNSGAMEKVVDVVATIIRYGNEVR